jgi:release factor glutamine methyltransferase
MPLMSPSDPWTVRRILEWTTPFFTRKEVDSPRLSAELLLSHVLETPRIKLYTDYDRTLTPPQLATYRALVQRAAEHEPIAYLTNRAFFFGLELEITPDVLIPRPDTETLVENVLQLSRNSPGFEAPRILELCTGSGCISIAIASRMKNANILATDISEKALAVAQRNVARHNLSNQIALVQGDLFDALKDIVDPQPFNLILANPPYIPSGQIAQLDRNVRDYEPRQALDGGPDGLTFLRRIVMGARERLLPGGRFFLEIAFDQSEQALGLLADVPDFDEVKVLKDTAANPRVLTARKR